MNEIGRPPERKRILVVWTVTEVQQVLSLLPGVEGVLARLLYGAGMRLSEGLSLREKDLDFDRHVFVVSSGNGDKDRVVMLPHSLAPVLRERLATSRALWGGLIEHRVRQECSCLMHWIRNTPGRGIGCSLRPSFLLIQSAFGH